MSEYRFEKEGTGEWFCAKTGAPELPRPLCYRVKMTRHNGIEVAIVDPFRYNRLGRLGKKLVLRQSGKWELQESDDWRHLIGRLATACWDFLEEDRAEKAAKANENPYFGEFCRGADTTMPNPPA